MAELITTDSSPSATSATGPSRPTKILVWTAIVALSSFVGVQGYTLASEWAALRHELKRAAENVTVGYVNVTPKVNHARPPHVFIRDVGDETLLWSGWVDGAHQWFRLPKGQIVATEFSSPMGRDRARAIDDPIVEIGDGRRWRRIPDDSQVFGLVHAGWAVAYPMKVLDKVVVVNDLVEGVPFLVTFSPFEAADEAVSAFDAVLEGKRTNMGHTGYFIEGKPVLYDRETESFWVKRDAALRSIAGKRKGASLRLVSRLQVSPWSEWRDRNPKGRLLVGANRPGITPVSDAEP